MEFTEKPMQFVRKQMEMCHHDPSFVSSLYEKAGDKITDEEEAIIKWSAASLYAAGADTVGFQFRFTLLVLQGSS